MARIIIRKSKSIDGSNVGTNNGSDGNAERNDGIVAEPAITRTGEPDPDDFAATGNDTGSGESVNGNSARFIDPNSVTGGASDGTPKRRGRPRGSRNGTNNRASKTQTSQDLGTLLFTVHFGLANMFRSPSLIITEDEAKALGAAVSRVTELYDIAIIPEKQMAWINLIVTAGGIYGPRIVAANMNKKQKRAQVISIPNPFDVSGGAL